MGRSRRRSGLLNHLLLLCFCLGSPLAGALQNQLEGHASPYLAMHAGDPVAWQDWSPGVLEQAEQEGRLILISSGYFSCHWCHVMQQESYQNSAIADYLNTHYIPVKLDRELNPALDAYLIDFLDRTQGQAGWPLNLFLTPEGYPLIGATYLPPARFRALLERLQASWTGNPDRMRNMARRVLLELSILPRSEDSESEPDPEQLRSRLVNEALMLGDPMEGGFGQQNKFPMAPQLYALLRLRETVPLEDLDHLLTLSLDQMATQGLRDHLGGGFFRYTVDPSWQVPHFEKMLYTQAQLARVYLLAGRIYQRPDYLDVARDTLDFVLREMRGPQGMFISSFSAVDATGEEGAYYLWHPAELKALLGEADSDLARQRWGMLGPPVLEGGYLPVEGDSPATLANRMGQSPDVLADRLKDVRQRLSQARAGRSLPADTKELAGWNGMLLGALAEAGVQLQEPAYLDEAVGLAGRLKAQLWRNAELWRASANDQPVGQAGLADYAYVAEGLALLTRVRQDADLLAWKQQLVDAAWNRFFGARGWRSAEKPPLPGMGSEWAIRDGALPAASAILLEVSRAGGDQELEAKAQQALQRALPVVQQEPFWYPSYLLRGNASD